MANLEQTFEEVFTLDCVEVDMDKYWTICDFIEEEICKAFERGTVDDMSITAYASNTHGDPRIHGQFRFCVYGGMKYKDMKKRLENLNSNTLTVSDIYHPEPTVGISFNGVYEDDDTTYIGGRYEFRVRKVRK